MPQISGVVRDPKGRPVSQARVYFTSAPVSLPDIAALTDEDGTFSLSAPTAGTYHIECVAESFSPTAAKVTVIADQRVHLEIRLKK